MFRRTEKSIKVTMLKVIQLRKKDNCSMKPASSMGASLPFYCTQATHRETEPGYGDESINSWTVIFLFCDKQL